MNTVDKIKDVVLNKYYGACQVQDVMQDLKLTKKQVLINIKKTLHVEKNNRQSDLLTYNKNPELPIKYQDILLGFRTVDNIEDMFLLFVKNEKYIPDLETFKEYAINYNCEFKFKFNWHNRNNYQSAKKKILRILKECNEVGQLTH